MTAKKKASPRDKAPAKSKAREGRSAPRAAPPVGSDSSSAKVVHTLLRPLAPLDATTRAAFRSLATDAHRSELGRQTKARGVLAEGVAMAVTIDQALATFRNLSELYPATRFAYLLESLLALDALLAQSSSREHKLGAARGVAATERDRAIQARKRLLKRLGRFAGRREDENRELLEVPPQGRSNEELRKSIQSAVALANKWRARADPASRALAHAAALDPLVIDAADAAAAALDKANVDATLEGRKSSHDSPLVNLEEGNVLLEMEHAIDVFEEAHDDNDVVPRLIPGPATRHVLVASSRPAAEPEPTPPPAGPGDASSPGAPADR